MSRAFRHPSWSWTTTVLSVALAAMLGVTLYLSASSLPYLAVSPSTDPTFGSLNACLHAALPSRTGFAAGRDARRVLAWSTSMVAQCTAGEDGPRLATWPLSGVTVGAFDGGGAAYVVSQPGGLTSTLYRLEAGTPRALGESAAVAIAGAADGVVVLELSGRLVSVDGSGAVRAAVDGPLARGLVLSASADGRRVAITGDGAVRVFDAERLTPVRLEAPCDVESFWWLKAGHVALLSCRPDGLALVLDVDTGAQETAPRARRTPSVLAGPHGPYVEPCDVLPCTSRPPLEES